MSGGIVQDLFASERARMLWGVFFMIMGTGWIVENYTGYRLSIGSLWPLALVIFGALVFLSRDRMRALSREADATPATNEAPR
ncbi:MAG TPA: hypothetical protein VM681_08170 [Candidatus Thermoplasmatota archaeon]|nr:hypothetical protein [Candidatus Thermoplasmatota archaeon]